MGLKTLSPFPYYGGKAKMAPLICDMLDYNSTDIYIEPFGGACRVLLNKPRHMDETYNDSSAGLCAFMRVMSNNETANKLINRLYETVYSPEEFYNAVLVRNEAEDNYIDELRRQVTLYLKQLITKYSSDDLVILKGNIQHREIQTIPKNYETLIQSNLLCQEELAVLEGFKKQFNQYMGIYNGIALRAYREQYRLHYNDFRDGAINMVNELSTNTDKLKVDTLQNVVSDVNQMKISSLDKKVKNKLRKMSLQEAFEIAYSETANTHDDIDTDDIELAAATYVIYSQSRDGMGKDWSSSKYKSTDDFHSQISRLYEVAERLEGVHVSQVGALSFLLECSYLNDARAMIYCDPSYLKPGDEKKNLGSVYKDSFTYEDHELFLQTICNAKCKLLVSNYNVPLYNKYLNEKNGWNRIEFETTTSVGGKKDNERLEVLWYKY